MFVIGRFTSWASWVRRLCATVRRDTNAGKSLGRLWCTDLLDVCGLSQVAEAGRTASKAKIWPGWATPRSRMQWLTALP